MWQLYRRVGRTWDFNSKVPIDSLLGLSDQGFNMGLWSGRPLWSSTGCLASWQAQRTVGLGITSKTTSTMTLDDLLGPPPLAYWIRMESMVTLIRLSEKVAGREMERA